MPESFVTVATFETPMEAQLARNQLDEEGIDAFLEGAETVVMFTNLGGAMGGVKLQVAAEDARRAQAILGQRLQSPDKPVRDDYGLDREASKTAIRARAFDVDEEEEELPESAADATARRAWRAAVIGLLVFPPLLHVYSLWQLLQIPAAEDQLSDAGKRRLYAAVALDAIVFGAAALLWFGLLRGVIR
jgi:Putative prokaryotic signal transducing protein